MLIINYKCRGVVSKTIIKVDTMYLYDVTWARSFGECAQILLGLKFENGHTPIKSKHSVLK